MWLIFVFILIAVIALMFAIFYFNNEQPRVAKGGGTEWEYAFEFKNSQELSAMKKLLKNKGGKLRLEALMPINVYNPPKGCCDPNDQPYVRVRHEGDRINFTVKTDTSAKFVKEYEVEISKRDGDPIAEMDTILKTLGCTVKYRVEKIREFWDLPGAHEIVFDSLPGVPTYMEIDANTKEDLDRITKDLGLNPEDRIGNSDMYHRLYGIPADRKIPPGAELTFANAKDQFEGHFAKNEDLFDKTIAAQRKYLAKHQKRLTP